MERHAVRALRGGLPQIVNFQYLSASGGFNSQLSAAGGLAAVKMGKMHRKSPAALGR